MTICVVGMGYVGLPLALAFAGKSERVYGLDIDKEKVDKLRKGESYFKTIDNEDVYKAVTSGCLVPTTDVSNIERCDSSYHMRANTIR